MAESPENTDEIRIKAAIERCQKTIDEEREDNPEEFQPGNVDYDAITSMRDVFAFCAGREADLVPAELRGLLAVLADAFVRADDEMSVHDEEWEREQADRDRLRQEREEHEAALRSAENFSVRIERADGKTVRVGPYTYRFQADIAAGYFRGCTVNTAGAEDAKVSVTPYDETQEHRVGLMTDYAWELADIMQAEGTDQEAGDFPDLYARFAAYHGEQASPLWRQACEIIDAPAVAEV
jgi:hypothetical protein